MGKLAWFVLVGMPLGTAGWKEKDEVGMGRREYSRLTSSKVLLQHHSMSH